MKPSTTESIDIRGLRCQVRLWGEPGAPLLFLLHGWMDVSASFQFVVDALERDWRVVAPDWRGFGGSQWRGDAYWFPDYVADLECLLDHYASGAPADLVGHSMGGNIACLYAGIRPQRVHRLVSLDGFGLAATAPEEAPERYRKWLDQLRAGAPQRVYADFEALAARMRRDNPRLSAERARFLAEHAGRADAHGQVRLVADGYHRIVSPILYRLEEAKACWREVEAPVLWVLGAESELLRRFVGQEDDYRARIACFRDFREVRVADAGHMLQHDQPERVARLIEEFLAG